MNKSLLLLGLASVMSAFTGCATDEAENAGVPEQQQGQSPKVLTAQLGDPGTTRVAISPTGKSLYWSEGDVIAVYSEKGQNQKIRYRLNPTFAKSAHGEFNLIEGQTGEISKASYGTFDGIEDFTYVAVYPSAQYYLKTSYPMEIGATIPITQQYVEGSIDPKAAPMMAVFNTDTPNQVPTTLKFKYLASFVHLPLSASAPASLERVVVTGSKGTSGNSLGKLAGTISWRFYPQLYYNKKADRDTNFTDMSTPMNYKKAGDAAITGFLDQVTLKGHIALDSNVKDLYFGVLPYTYGGANASTRLIFSFFFDDGSVVEKTAKPKDDTNLEPGNMLTLPAFKFDLPYMPSPKLSNDMLSWERNNEVAESCSIVVWQDDEVLTTIPVEKTVNSIKIKEVVYPALEELIGSSLTAGVEYDFSLGIKALYNTDKVSYADAVYSKSIAIPTYTAIIPKISLSVSSDQDRGKITTNNYKAYEKMDYAVVELSTDRDPVETDFNAATFTEIKDMVTRFQADYWKTYGIMVRSYVKGSLDQKKMAKFALPIPEQKLKLELGEAIFISNYSLLKTCYNPTATTLYFIEGKDVTDFTNAKSVTYEEWGMSYDNFLPTDCWDKDWSFKIVMKAEKFEGGAIEVTGSKYLPKPWWID